jgi:hypothetical protein
MEQLRTFQIYAGLTFLGYEYAADKEDALIKTRHKFGAPKKWNIDEFSATIIKWPGENENFERATEKTVA